ncbi:hypothetical protein ABBQ38_001764 [Trebouxia sp. C0009 RCD-2024]
MAVTDLQAYVRQIRERIVDNDYEPEFDEKDDKKDKALRENEDLNHGAILRGTLQEGDGQHAAQEGDLVYIHVAVKSASGKLLESTRKEQGGSGRPLAFVLGKGIRAPRGWELALQDMVQQQRCELAIKPEYAYKHKDCQVKSPRGANINETLHFDITLLEIYSRDNVRVVGPREDIYKTIKHRSDFWETPHEPYDVEISCSARLPSTSGRHMDSTPYFTAASLKFSVGSGAAPSGLEEGLSSMVKGERAVISCPAQYACGGSMLPHPPGHPERVEFELHLLTLAQVRDLTGKGEVIKRRIREGTGQFPMDCPIQDSKVRIHYRGYLADTGQEFINTRDPDEDREPYEFDTGMGVLPEAIDMSVRLMTPGEVSSITSSSQYAYDGRPDRPAGVPHGAQVKWDVELISFEKQQDWERAEPDVKIERAGKLKEQGNAAFKAGQLKFARNKYTKALRLADRLFDIETEEQAEAAAVVKTACLVNLANCAHKEQQYGEALDWCNKALRESDDHVKALYRRAMAYTALGEFERAEQDLNKWKELEPSAAADAAAQISKLRAVQKAANAKQKQQFRNFFGHARD